MFYEVLPKSYKNYKLWEENEWMRKMTQTPDQKSKNDYIESFCKENWEELYRFIYYRVQNREEAEDITQEAFEKTIYQNLNSNVSVLNHKNYLKTIALNIIRDRFRKIKARAMTIDIEEVKGKEPADDDFADLVVERYRVEEALSKLTIDQRKVLEYRILKGYSIKETAQKMNKKENAVKVLQFRAVKAMYKLMSEM